MRCKTDVHDRTVAIYFSCFTIINVLEIFDRRRDRRHVSCLHSVLLLVGGCARGHSISRSTVRASPNRAYCDEVCVQCQGLGARCIVAIKNACGVPLLGRNYIRDGADYDALMVIFVCVACCC